MPKKVDNKKPRGAKKKADTIKKRQDLQKKKLLEFVEDSPNIGVALSRIGINRSTLGRWRDDDQNFSIELNHAMERGIEKTADNVELSLIASARDGKVPAQKYYLNNNHPRYMRSRFEEPEENPLTEERKEQIYRAVKAWSSYDHGDERYEDYELSDNDKGTVRAPIEYDDEGNMIR